MEENVLVNNPDENKNGPEFIVAPKAKRKLEFINMFNRINCDDLDEDDLAALRDGVKEIEKKVKENNKPKTITVPGKVHASVKKYCKNLNLSIGEWTAEVLLKEIEENTCYVEDERDRDEILESDMKEVEKRFIDNLNRDRYLIKVNRILMAKNLHFAGYSQYDGNPIYEYSGKLKFSETREFAALDSYGIEIKLVNNKEVSKSIITSAKQVSKNIDVLYL